METRVFTCADCGDEVHAIGITYANDQDLCAECVWIRSIGDPVQRQQLKEWLKSRRDK